MTDASGTAGTPISGTRKSDATEFILRSEIGAIESRIVRHVEEVTSGSEATQNLLRNELQLEGERRAERHSLHLCKIEASCMELTCRLNDAEQRWSAAQQDTMSELKSLQGHVEAVNGKSLSNRIDESDKRLQASRQELFAEVAKLRAEFTVRSEDAANERRLEFRSRTEQLETRIEELGRNVAETAGFLVRLGAVEQQLATARAHPSTATLDAKITTLTARTEAAEVKCRDLEQQVESTAKEQVKSVATAPTATATSPALALVIERLQARVEDTERQLVAGGTLKKVASLGETEELRTMVIDSRAHMELLTTSFATERKEYQRLLADVSKRQTDEQANLAHVVDEMHAELRVELASRAQEIAAKLSAELKAHVETRIGVTERDAIASVKESLGTGFQAALTVLMGHVKQLQAAAAQTDHLAPRIANIEHELRGTTRLVTNLAQRALDERDSSEAGSTSVSTTDALSGSAKARSDMIQGLTSLLDKTINTMARSTSPGQQRWQDTSTTVPAATGMDKTINTMVRSTSPGQQGRQGTSMPVPAANGMPSMVQTPRERLNAAARFQMASAGMTDTSGSSSVPGADHLVQTRDSLNASARFQMASAGIAENSVSLTIPAENDNLVQTREILNAAARSLASTAIPEILDLGGDVDDSRVKGVNARGRSLEQTKAVAKAAAQRPHTTLGTQRPNPVLSVSTPTDKIAASVKRQISARAPGHTSPRHESTSVGLRSPRPNFRPESPIKSVELPIGVARLASGPAPGPGTSTPVAIQTGQAMRLSTGGQFPMVNYTPMGT